MSASEKERENMSLYSVLLVDDEEEVFQVIMKKLDWEGMGFRIAGYARNGVEALEMAEELSVDVVMTDIKMPYMDGLTLCRKLKEQYQKIKVIIFSGFDEFEYAREAIKIEAEEYILKPINANELREVFERIKNNLDKELDEKRNIDKLREYYLESLPMLQENFLTSLIDGRISEDSIEEYARNCSLTLKGPYFVVTVLHISTTNPMEGALPIDPFLLAVSVKKLAEELGVGEITLSDILDELEKPGRDIRDTLPPPVLRDRVLTIEDLTEGMVLTGTVRNVIDFGAFVDIGVHQDGLLHISEMSDRFIKHPSELYSVGDIIKVTVKSVDVKKKRISLTRRGMGKD